MGRTKRARREGQGMDQHGRQRPDGEVPGDSPGGEHQCVPQGLEGRRVPEEPEVVLEAHEGGPEIEGSEGEIEETEEDAVAPGARP